MSIAELEKLCEKKRKSLIRRAKAKGISENFGAKEVRAIEDAGMNIAHDPAVGWNDRHKVAGIVSNFCEWVWTFDL